LCGSCGADKTRVFLCFFFVKASDLFLKQFYVKLGRNKNDICTMLSEAYDREAMKKSSVFEWHKRFK
jgi:hypothetical protein